MIPGRIGLQLFLVLLALGAAGCDLFREEPGECSTGFNDPDALGRIFDGAVTTFTYATGRDASGRLERCDERIHDTCWTYREQCDEDWIRVEPVTNSHFHLVSDNPDVQFGICDSDFGFFTGTRDDCTMLDPTTVTRALYPHEASDWVKLWVEDGMTGDASAFDLRRVTVDADEPIQLWIKKTDGTWMCWDHLDHSKSWDVERWAGDIVEARIRGVEGSISPYRIAGFALTE